MKICQRMALIHWGGLNSLGDLYLEVVLKIGLTVYLSFWQFASDLSITYQWFINHLIYMLVYFMVLGQEHFQMVVSEDQETAVWHIPPSESTRHLILRKTSSQNFKIQTVVQSNKLLADYFVLLTFFFFKRFFFCYFQDFFFIAM
jgi:hypothetical protein